MGFAGGGFALAVLSQNLLNNKSSSSSPSFPPPSDDSPVSSLPPQQESPKPPPETPAPKPSANSLPTFDFATVTVNSTGQI
ncbi:MAG: serine/threonine protein kinase, partial [Oscillatoriales cyanobacterium]